MFQKHASSAATVSIIGRPTGGGEDRWDRPRVAKRSRGARIGENVLKKRTKRWLMDEDELARREFAHDLDGVASKRQLVRDRGR